MFDEDLLFTIEQWRPFHHGKDAPLEVTSNAKSVLRAMGSNRVIITLEQHVDVLEGFRTIVSK